MRSRAASRAKIPEELAADGEIEALQVNEDLLILLVTAVFLGG